MRLLRKDRFLAPEGTITVRVDMELSSPKQQIMTLRPPEILSATMFFLDKDEEELGSKPLNVPSGCTHIRYDTDDDSRRTDISIVYTFFYTIDDTPGVKKIKGAIDDLKKRFNR